MAMSPGEPGQSLRCEGVLLLLLSCAFALWCSAVDLQVMIAGGDGSERREKEDVEMFDLGQTLVCPSPFPDSPAEKKESYTDLLRA